MTNIEHARALLDAGEVFFPVFDEGDSPQVINQNDTWGWAIAFGQPVTDEELPQVADLFSRYGDCGVLYWVSEKNGGMQSEFPMINRWVEFVRHEERIRAAHDSASGHAYHVEEYTIGADAAAKA